MIVEYSYDDRTEVATMRYADGTRVTRYAPVRVESDLRGYLTYESFWARTQRR